MQRILTLILALALYAPNVASLLAYSECEMTAILKNKPDCDCKLASVSQQNNPSNFPDKHKEIMQQTDWKYVIKNSFQPPESIDIVGLQAFQLYRSPYCASLNGNEIFHPPCC